MLFQQNSNSGDMDKCQELDVEFIIACKYSAKPFELLKKAFNQMALLVGVPVYRPRVVDVALWRDRISSILRNDVFSDRFRTVCFVTEDIAPSNIDLAEQWDSVNGIVVTAGTEQKSKRIA